jgi:Cyclin, N-terminal domain/Cyclin, C-terminal domain
MNLFDRYLATRDNHCSGNLALLTSLTTLHIAVKLEDSKKVSLDVLSQLSRGQFSREDIDRMEWSVLSELGWKVHPPTEYSFLAYYLMFLPTETPLSVRRDLEDLARYVCELAIYDSFFVGMKSSEISFAAFLNVIDDMDCHRLPLTHREIFARNINRIAGLSAYSESVIAARQRLRKMFVGSSASYQPCNADNYSPQSVGYLSTYDKIARTISSNSSSKSNSSRSSKGGKRVERNRNQSAETTYCYPNTMQQRCVAVSPMVCSSSRVHKNYSPLASAH